MSHNEVRAVADIAPADLEEYYSLFETAFEASEDGFINDFLEKDYVLEIRRHGQLVAFSTLRVLHPEPGVRLLFSGDTFSAETSRAGQALPALWAQFVFNELPKEPNSADYWLLLCSGYRTYRILPTFFRNFVPSVPPLGSQDPAHTAALAKLENERERWGKALFAENYRNGAVIPRWATPLRAPEPPVRLANDLHVQAFLKWNPGYRQGHELVCLVPLERENLRPAGARLVTSSVPLSGPG